MCPICQSKLSFVVRDHKTFTLYLCWDCKMQFSAYKEAYAVHPVPEVPSVQHLHDSHEDGGGDAPSVLLRPPVPVEEVMTSTHQYQCPNCRCWNPADDYTNVLRDYLVYQCHACGKQFLVKRIWRAP